MRFVPSEGRRRELREQLRIPAEAAVVGTVSSLNPMKGLEHFLDAAGRGCSTAARGLVRGRRRRSRVPPRLSGAAAPAGRRVGTPEPGRLRLGRARRRRAVVPGLRPPPDHLASTLGGDDDHGHGSPGVRCSRRRDAGWRRRRGRRRRSHRSARAPRAAGRHRRRRPAASGRRGVAGSDGRCRQEGDEPPSRGSTSSAPRTSTYRRTTPLSRTRPRAVRAIWRRWSR